MVLVTWMSSRDLSPYSSELILDPASFLRIMSFNKLVTNYMYYKLSLYNTPLIAYYF